MIRLIFTVAILMLGLTLAEPALADNLLNGLKSEIQSNFGKDSDFMYALLFVEFIASLVLYIKTKNLMVMVLGLPVVILVTTFVFNTILG